MLEVRRLRLLRELSLRGTIAATAQACSLTPSAVSQQLAALERDVRTPLLIRDGRGIVLTEAARILAARTERILADLEAAEADVANLSSDVRGVVRIAAFPTAASALAAPAIARCAAEHPDLRPLLSESETPEAIPAVRAGHVDVALVYEYNLLAAAKAPGIEVLELVTEPLLAALPEHVDRPEEALRLDTLSDHRWIVPRSDSALRRSIERACELAGFQPQLDYASDDYTVILALVSAGLGVALIPRLAIESISADVRLREVSEPRIARTVSAAIRRGSRGHPTIAAVLAALTATASELNIRSTNADPKKP